MITVISNIYYLFGHVLACAGTFVYVLACTGTPINILYTPEKNSITRKRCDARASKTLKEKLSNSSIEVRRR